MEINFKKVHTAKDLAISTIVLLAGVGLFFINKGLGITIVVCGLAMLFLYKGGYRKDGHSALLARKSEDLCKCCKQSIVDFLHGKDTEPQVKKGHNGGSVRLDVYFNEASGIAYAQLYDFRNYTYEPETEIVELHSPRADKLISLL